MPVKQVDKKTNMGKKKKKTPENVIWEFIIQRKKKKYSIKQLYDKFIPPYTLDEIDLAVKVLDKNNKIEKLSAKKFRLVEKNKNQNQSQTKKTTSDNLIKGKVDMTQHGHAFIISEDTENDIYIRTENLNRAMDNDEVLVAITKVNKRGRAEGKVIEITQRFRTQFFGTIQKHDHYAFLIIDDPRINFDIFIPKKNLNDAKNGEKVIVKIEDWGSLDSSPIGIVVESMGKAGADEVEMKTILIEKGFNLQFSKEVMKEADDFPDYIPESEISKRLDYRKPLTFTIDPADAKDFDDALSVQKLKNGNYEIGVHIADVSHFVQSGTKLDDEALERSTSVYLVGRVCPMLPERISNHLCSLRPNEDRMAFSVIFEITTKAEVKNFQISKTIIHSDKRFTYEDAQEIIEKKKGKFAPELNLLNEIAQLLRKNRFNEGSINFDKPEVQFELNEDNFPIGVKTKERKDAHLLVEDFMLLANKTTARYMSKLVAGKSPIPFVYRIHDAPDLGKLETFSAMAAKFGHHVKFSNPEQISASLNILLGKIKGRKEQNILEQLAIRSMAKAAYTTKNIGHYGLAFDFYTHFTSPIRRYPDLVVHRIIDHFLTKKEAYYEQSLLEDICKHSSFKERNAMQAEWESIKYKQVQFMMNKIGESFDGVISGVIARGFFVELAENKCEGFVDIDSLQQDFVFDTDDYSLTSPSTGQKLRLGDDVRVKLIDTSLKKRRIDFEWLMDE
ncbi:MAG: ribonuclease R [Chitinophagaceae bacterium]|nr:MAG: ribonuclease R [Chitinophagaceae bacterium]